MGKIIITIEDSEEGDGKIDISASFPNNDTIADVVQAFKEVFSVFSEQVKAHFNVESDEELRFIFDNCNDAKLLKVRDVLTDVEVSNG